MPTLDELKAQIDGLKPEEQIELGNYATSKGTVAKKSVEEAKLLVSLPTPITDSDKAFIEKNKNNKNIKRDKIKFTETTIELDGLKFPRTIVRYDDVKNTPGLKLNTNVYKNNGYDYFTFDAVKQLGNAGKKIPSKDQRQQAANVFGGYGLLGQTLNYPKAGVRRSYGTRDYVGAGSFLWSSTPRDASDAYGVWFSTDGNGNQYWDDQSNARSLVFLQG